MTNNSEYKKYVMNSLRKILCSANRTYPQVWYPFEEGSLVLDVKEIKSSGGLVGKMVVALKESKMCSPFGFIYHPRLTLWGMSYFGRVVELPNDLMANYKSPINTPAREFAERVLSFHKAAVSSAKDPVRSVQKYPAKDRNSEGFSYQSVFEGDLSNFSRQDIVFHTRREPLTVFKMTYTGGILVTPDWP